MKQEPRALASHWSATPMVRILGPMQQFISQEASSGIILLGMTIIALAIANSPLAERYQALLETELTTSAGPFALHATLLHWINDGLMAIFFFVVGLEIKREVVVGELSASSLSERRLKRRFPSHLGYMIGLESLSTPP